MITPFKLPDNGIPISVGDKSFIYKDVFHPIEWYAGEPYRPRVETLVLNKLGTEIFLRIKDDKKSYRLPGGSIDNDSSYEKQAENEVNEEALVSVEDVKFSNITYHEAMDRDFIKKGGDSPLAYVGAITYVYTAFYTGKIDKKTIEEKDLDDDMAKFGKFYPLPTVFHLLSRYHLEALVKSNRIYGPFLSLLSKRLNEMTVESEKFPMFEASSMFGKTGEHQYIYHGSTCKFDTFHPMSIDLGNGLQKPGWSTFCFRNYDWARRFAIMRLVQNYLEKTYGDSKDSKYECNWDLHNNRPYIHKDMFNEVCDALCNEYIYVYTIDSENLELGIGNDARFPEVTFREDNVKPLKINRINTSADILKSDITLIDKNPVDFEKEQLDSIQYVNRGWVNCMLNRNFSEDSSVGKLMKAVSEGKLKPGDDIEQFMVENNIILDDVSFLERFKEMDAIETSVSESFDISGEFEQTLLLGDNRMLYTSEKKDIYADSKTDEEKVLLPSDKGIPNNSKLQYKGYLYDITDGKTIFPVGHCDITTLELNDDIYGLIRIFVRPAYRNHGIGRLLLGYVLRYLKTLSPMNLLVEIHKDIWNISGIQNWVASYGFSNFGETEHSVCLKTSPMALESCTNLSNLGWYHAILAKKGFDPKARNYVWDEEQWMKNIDYAVKDEIQHVRSWRHEDELNEISKDKFRMHMYTAGEELSAIYLGTITVYNYNGDTFDWEWDEIQDIDSRLLDYIKEEIHPKLLSESLLVEDNRTILIEAEGDDDLPSLGKDDKTNDYSADAEKSVKNDNSNESDNGDTNKGNPDDLDKDMGSSDYTEDANQEDDTLEEPQEDNSNSDEQSTDDSSNDEGGDLDNLDSTDYTDDASNGDEGQSEDSYGNNDNQESKNQTNNNTIKNYSILRDFESLYRLANEMSDTLEPIIMEKPIQNKVLTQVRENLSAIKKAIIDFITLHFKPDRYSFNLYYYEVFFGVLRKNMEILERNKLFSEEKSPKLKRNQNEIKGGSLNNGKIN